MRLIYALCLTALFILMPSSVSADDVPKYSVGQGWVIQSGPYKGQEVIISHKENYDTIGNVYHISVYGPIENNAGQIVPAMPHFPFALEGLEKSDLKFTTDYDVVPKHWQEGYAIWKDAFDKGKAGVFTVSVPEAMDLIFRMIPPSADVQP